MRRIAKIAAAIISGTAAIAAEPFAEPPKQYSIVEVAHESRACRPAFSNNCITLKKGERVVVLAWQIDDNPRRGLYCLRPLNMGECYYADLTAIEIDGKPVPTIDMDKPPDEKPIPAEDCKALPQGIEGLKATTMDQLMRYQKCLAMDGGEQLLQLYRKWVYVSVCNKSREGYLVQYVNDVELERARRGVKGAERELLMRNPPLAERSQMPRLNVVEQLVQLEHVQAHASFVQLNDYVVANVVNVSNGVSRQKTAVSAASRFNSASRSRIAASRTVSSRRKKWSSFSMRISFTMQGWAKRPVPAD